MKKIIIGISAPLVIIVFYLLFFNKSQFIKYKLDNKTYNLLKAENSSEWSKGLMFYKSKKELNGADGMIFIFPDKEYRTFWNQDTYLDLDVYWLDDDKVAGKDFLPSILKSKETVTVNSPKEVDKVVEIIR